MERDRFTIIIFFKTINFNSHAHVERDLAWGGNGFWGNNFNSHAHVERDDIDEYVKMHQLISTHTLTWSVTL